MKNLAKTLWVGSLVAAIVQWWQIGYRLYLFFGDCHGERYVNHVGVDDFFFLYVANGLLLIMILLPIWMFREVRGWCIASVIVGLINLSGWMAWFVMHETGVLVGYGEFIRHWKR